LKAINKKKKKNKIEKILPTEREVEYPLSKSGSDGSAWTICRPVSAPQKKGTR
jgi:hypothetical protein